MMDFSLRKFVLFLSLCALAGWTHAQLPNEKFGKPSSMEWEFFGWGDALDADALILCKTMKVTYKLSDQVANYNRSESAISFDNFTDFGKNQIDPNSIIVKHEFRLRTKILKPEGARHANIDITYYDTDFGKSDYNDELNDLKIRVFTKNEKGKVVKRSVDTKGFARERINENYVVLHVEVPDVQAGSIIEYQYDISSTRPGFLYDWVFQDSIPTVFTKCDIDIPAILQFNMNVPIHRLIRSGVEVGRLNYDTNRPDMKKGKSCPTNHYTVIGEYIVPEGHPLKNNTTADKIAPFTSQIITPGITPPPALPAGSTHLKIQ